MNYTNSLLAAPLNDDYLPDHLVGSSDCYARCIPYLDSRQTLINEIESAHHRRTNHAGPITNMRQRMLYNSQ